MATEDLSSPAYSSTPVTPILNTSDAERAIEATTTPESEAERLLDQMSSPEVSTPEVSAGQTRASMQAESSRILGMTTQ